MLHIGVVVGLLPAQGSRTESSQGTSAQSFDKGNPPANWSFLQCADNARRFKTDWAIPEDVE